MSQENNNNNNGSGSSNNSSKKQFAAELQVKEVVDTIFLVKQISIMEGRDGRSYLNLILSDNTGDIEGRIWNNAQEIKLKIEQGNLAKIKGKVNLYQNKKQLIISEISMLSLNSDDYNSDSDINLYLSKSNQNFEDMFKRICSIVNEELDNAPIKELLTLILSDNEIAQKVKVWPAGKNIHHAYQSGLLEHILSCAEISLLIGKHFSANINYLVAASILHDLGKIFELTSGLNIEYTNEGKLIGHVIKGLEIVDEFSLKIINFPSDIKMHLKHILLSHHGEYDYGSAKLPQTREAILFHSIDLMDSKIGSVDLIIKNDPVVGNWSSYIKHLDRIIFKGKL
ncbi:MAG: HD domain-containing protein [Oligoflexia bacterium]|nr:HD domain-containing protein [Oligoflexia bacterium]